ncbi:MAG: LysR family transcriptional regulator [Raoultibacter sp.]
MADQKYEAFIRVSETGSFKQAAEDLGYTQAGISYIINALEKEYGTPLFVREYGGTHLTAEGHALLPLIHTIRNSERQLETKIAELKHLECGIVRVASFTSTSIHWLPGITKLFHDQHPTIELEFINSDDQDQVERMVWDGDVDCGFFALPISRELETVSLREDPLLVVLPKDHPETGAPFFSKKALETYPYVRLHNSAFTEMDALFSKHGVTPNTAYAIDNDYAVLGMVSEGLGFSIFPELILRDPLFDIVYKQPEIPTTRELAIAVRSLGSASAATHAFLNCTQNWIKNAYREEPDFASSLSARIATKRPNNRSTPKTR